MKTTIIFDGKTFIELNNKAPRMINKACSCGNPLYIPVATLVLGLIEDCAHCGKDYPAKAHCNAITESYKGLIEDGGNICLD